MTSISPDDPWGLCGHCRHGRSVTSGKKGSYLLCERSFSDPLFPKYPTVPVIQCAGFEGKADSPDRGERR